MTNSTKGPDVTAEEPRTSERQEGVLRQPWLHDLAITVHGNATQLSSPQGDIEPGTAQGVFLDDARVLDRLVLRVGGEPASPVASSARGERAEFFGAARGLGNSGSDPTVEVHRTRTLGDATMVENITVTSRASDEVRATLEVELGADGAPIAWVKSGRVRGDVLTPTRVGDVVHLVTLRHDVEVGFEPPADAITTSTDHAVATRSVVVAPGASVSWRLRVTATRREVSRFDADPGADAVSWQAVDVTADDPGSRRWSPTPSTTSASCCCAIRSTLRTSSPQRDPLGTSPSSVVTRSGRPG
ncbi:glycogen debranching N-terminal domain-containing protein [Nostocoides sp. HKS02]|uniref:glycogen debranching N-terminal domain-containing protein n=1 Tax=Nostocoides sp. HKS02 TaxID=1813880 RepID=UPI0018A82E77|nr:glycogen debranching N-terminal domain-containing protein [Tetrasphaera sp. HKS02]